MILNPMPEINTSQFAWNPLTKTFVACASDLQWAPGWPPLNRVYDDACDEGFSLVSHVTGQKMAVAVEKIEDSADYSGGWKQITFVPAEHAKRNDFTVVVFND
jgi:hypothetical protein